MYVYNIYIYIHIYMYNKNIRHNISIQGQCAAMRHQAILCIYIVCGMYMDQTSKNSTYKHRVCVCVVCISTNLSKVPPDSLCVYMYVCVYVCIRYTYRHTLVKSVHSAAQTQNVSCPATPHPLCVYVCMYICGIYINKPNKVSANSRANTERFLSSSPTLFLRFPSIPLSASSASSSCFEWW